MPELTEIRQTARGRYALLLDGAFAFSLDEETFAAAGLHTADWLDEAEVEALRRQSDTRKAADKAMELLALRDHAAGELYQKLCRRFDAPSAAAAVAKMQALGLLDDGSAARRRAAELLRKKKSRREIEADLRAKGIDRDTAAAVLAELYEGDGGEGPDPELENARRLVQGAYASRLAAGRRDAVAAALARRGFAHAVIRAVLDEARDACPDDPGDAP